MTQNLLITGAGVDCTKGIGFPMAATLLSEIAAYIEAWHQASEWVKNAKHIVVIGYSFNGADEHFNDILRQQLYGKAVTIVGPGVHDDAFLKRMEKVFHVPKDNWVSTKVQNLPAKRANHFQLVKAYADQVDVGALFA